MKDGQNLLKKGNTWKVITSLAIPSVIITLVMALYNMADIFFIERPEILIWSMRLQSVCRYLRLFRHLVLWSACLCSTSS